MSRGWLVLTHFAVRRFTSFCSLPLRNDDVQRLKHCLQRAPTFTKSMSPFVFFFFFRQRERQSSFSCWAISARANSDRLAPRRQNVSFLLNRLYTIFGFRLSCTCARNAFHDIGNWLWSCKMCGNKDLFT